ncbi:hypothetical protein ARMGADRAFT_425520 [Armillaria gallica]|uniref:Uncharacterized protein n=1 Tax=Armillaria gallica TaxID=47427 RepID=A0A2H3E1V3_ARMGA|nr:hypothetical protein ARMGADRAFT_425520 [Armillaria gallica]
MQRSDSCPVRRLCFIVSRPFYSLQPRFESPCRRRYYGERGPSLANSLHTQYCLATKRAQFKDLIKLSTKDSEEGLAIRNLHAKQRRRSDSRIRFHRHASSTCNSARLDMGIYHQRSRQISFGQQSMARFMDFAQGWEELLQLWIKIGTATQPSQESKQSISEQQT